MQTALMIVHALIAVALVGVVLLQRSEGGALGIGGGGGGLMTGRGATNLLTRTTAIRAALFFATSIALAIMATANHRPRSILDATPQPATAPAPASPAAPAAPAPAAPAKPAEPQVPLSK